MIGILVSSQNKSMYLLTNGKLSGSGRFVPPLLCVCVAFKGIVVDLKEKRDLRG